MHFVEHLLLGKVINPVALARKNSQSPHYWRDLLVAQHLDLSTKVSFTALRQQSELARYLSSKESQLSRTVYENFDQNAAEEQLRELGQIKRAVA